MRVEDWKGWRAATWTAVAIWLVFAVRLMIADVWDETNGMLAFSADAPLGGKLQFVLTESLGFWRPLPTLLVTVSLHFVRDFEVSWRILRAVNIAMLLGTFLLMIRMLSCGAERNRAPEFALTIALLFSGSAVITAGWYANVFDASALLMVMSGLSLLLYGDAGRDRGPSPERLRAHWSPNVREVLAGVLLGIAFFCKEAAALSLPFLLVLYAAGRIRFAQALRAGIPASILGAVYFGFRSRIVPFGSEGDIHGFSSEQLWPTVVNLASSFWLQNLKGSGPGLLGVAFLVLSLLALRRPRVIGAALVLFAATAVIYWGMFGEWQNGVLMHHLNFVGRLFLIPTALMLLLLGLERKTIALAMLCIPIVIGGVTTWRDHARFQRTYARIYRTASEAPVKPLTVHYPVKPLDDTVRGIRIGDLPRAAVKIDARTGRVLF